MARHRIIKRELDNLITLGIKDDTALKIITSVYERGVADCSLYVYQERDKDVSIGKLKEILVKENIQL
jgi:hypothetical protein